MNRSAIIHALLIIAFVTMGISPACKFISGEHQWIEICTASGDVETIKVAVDTTQDKGHDHSQGPDDCGFCFTLTHSKTNLAAALIIKPPMPAHYMAVSAGTSVPSYLNTSSFRARAPPLRLS